MDFFFYIYIDFLAKEGQSFQQMIIYRMADVRRGSHLLQCYVCAVSSAFFRVKTGLCVQLLLTVKAAIF